MRVSLKLVVMAGLSALVLSMPLAVRADDDDDHDLARDLHEQGQIRALSDILGTVGNRIPGDIVAIDLVRQHERWVYRLQVVTGDGERKTVNVDASDGTILRPEGGDR